MSDTHARGAEALDLMVIRHHAVSDPSPIRRPTGALEILHRSTSEGREAEGVVLGVLREVGVETDVESLSEFGRLNHEPFGDTER